MGDGSISMADGLGFVAVDSNELRRKQKSLRSSSSNSSIKPFDLRDDEDELSEVLESVVSSKQEPETLSNIPASTDVGPPFTGPVASRCGSTAVALDPRSGRCGSTAAAGHLWSGLHRRPSPRVTTPFLPVVGWPKLRSTGRRPVSSEQAFFGLNSRWLLDSDVISVISVAAALLQMLLKHPHISVIAVASCCPVIATNSCPAIAVLL
ncbi:hypothetical protein RHGRI_001632 [Rhododendron griersonianum]|uniref:Uncharacterized protein n=1 Tax=Rhododendron griersonianum TaxID=479676 RepID=A0AAV6LM57_9ERIC|nr:hypothetical protein RHGRI_001632 [Rhododendron griersonianum]